MTLRVCSFWPGPTSCSESAPHASDAASVFRLARPYCAGFLRTSAPELFGKCTYACGDVYVGEWAGGQPHGWGTCRFIKGNVYEGGWAEGGYHGKGTYTYANGGDHQIQYRSPRHTPGCRA